jgi:hypothetical protein
VIHTLQGEGNRLVTSEFQARIDHAVASEFLVMMQLSSSLLQDVKETCML